MTTIIRPAHLIDLPQITQIYNHYVVNTAYTFDLTPFDPSERELWFRKYERSGPHRLLVATKGEDVIGYASSGIFREKPAYATSVETTIYVDHRFGNRKTGSLLYQQLFEALEHEDIHRAYAGITRPNLGSVKLHEKFDFHAIGLHTEVGRKFDQYWDVEWFEKTI